MRSKRAPAWTIVWGTVLCGVALAGPAGAASYYASPNGNDSNPGTSARPWKTLQPAKKALKPGDTLFLADGQYAGGIKFATSGTRERPIVFKAINAGRVIIRGDQTTERDAFIVYQANWIVFEGLVFQGATRAGIWVQSSNNVTVRNSIARNNGTWGIFTSYSDDLLLEGNECAYNRDQHGIYVSNSGDRPIVRNNVSHDNGTCGIQFNGDGKLTNPKLGTRGDGIIDRATVEGNVVYGNGARGGAAINLLVVCNSVCANNLVFDNLAGGISLYNDNLPTRTQWGSKNNLIAFNTVYFRSGEGRWCVSFTNGCTGNVVINNILSGGAKGAFQFDATSSFASDHNLVYSADNRYVAVNTTTNKMLSPADYFKATRNDPHSILGDPKFVDAAGAEPDFHLRADSPARGVAYRIAQVPADADGNRMPFPQLPSMGCFGGAPVPAVVDK